MRVCGRVCGHPCLSSGFFGTPYRVIKYAPKTAQPCQPSKVSPSSNMKCSSHLQTAMYRQTPVTFEINSKQVADQSMRSIYSEISKHIPTRVSTYLNYVLSSGKLADSHRKADAFHASQDPMVFFEDTREKGRVWVGCSNFNTPI